MTGRPILFSDHWVRAALDERRMQMRGAEIYARLITGGDGHAA